MMLRKVVFFSPLFLAGCNGFTTNYRLGRSGDVARTKSSSSSSSLQSVPSALDTLTSGLASILQLPSGVTVDETVSKVRLLRLYDIENSVPCRSIRERITELDLNVKAVIPAAPNSRSMTDPTYEYAHPILQDNNKDDDSSSTPEVPFLVAVKDDDGDNTIRVSGAENILAFLDDFVVGTGNDEDSSSNQQEFLEVLRTVGSYLAGWMRIGRGTQVASCATAIASKDEVNRPKKPLILYSYEGNQFCRLVREVLLELDLVYELRSAGKESPRRAELASITGGSSQCPYLIDGDVFMPESKDIIEYLYKTYALWTPPNELLEWTSPNVMGLAKPLFAALAPLQAGSGNDEDGDYPQKLQAAIRDIKAETTADKVVIYTYELSPFSSEATTLLDNLGVGYKEISLGKEWLPGLISPEGSIKRAALLEMTGQSSLPHIFVGGKAIGGLFSGNPGLLPGLEQGELMDLLGEAQKTKTSSVS